MTFTTWEDRTVTAIAPAEQAGLDDLITRPTRPSYDSGISDVPLLGDTIGDNFDRTVASGPRREALVEVTTGRRWTYQELRADVDVLALGLIDAGVAKGDRVGIWAPNMAEWTMLQYATAKIGAILVTIIGSSGWDALLEAGRRVPAGLLAERQAALSPDDPINIQYTSGTTGFPKGATLSHHNILNNAYFVGRLCGYTPADRVCIPVPFYHCFGMVLGNLACTSHGCTMVRHA